MKHKEVELYEFFMAVLMVPLPIEGNEDLVGLVEVKCGVNCECPEGYCAWEGPIPDNAYEGK